MPKPEEFYEAIDKKVQLLKLGCQHQDCDQLALHQYGIRNKDGEGYDVKLLCDNHMNTIVITVNPEPKEGHWVTEYFNNKIGGNKNE